jgi:hypothetical protein
MALGHLIGLIGLIVMFGNPSFRQAFILDHRKSSVAAFLEARSISTLFSMCRVKDTLRTSSRETEVDSFDATGSLLHDRSEVPTSDFNCAEGVEKQPADSQQSVPSVGSETSLDLPADRPCSQLELAARYQSPSREIAPHEPAMHTNLISVDDYIDYDTASGDEEENAFSANEPINKSGQESKCRIISVDDYIGDNTAVSGDELLPADSDKHKVTTAMVPAMPVPTLLPGGGALPNTFQRASVDDFIDCDTTVFDDHSISTHGISETEASSKPPMAIIHSSCEHKAFAPWSPTKATGQLLEPSIDPRSIWFKDKCRAGSNSHNEGSNDETAIMGDDSWDEESGFPRVIYIRTYDTLTILDNGQDTTNAIASNAKVEKVSRFLSLLPRSASRIDEDHVEYYRQTLVSL